MQVSINLLVQHRPTTQRELAKVHEAVELPGPWAALGKVDLDRNFVCWISQDRKSGGVWRAQGKGYMGHLCHQHDCSVMCRHWQAAKESHVSWREPWAAPLSAGWEGESINRIPSALDEWSKGGFLGPRVYVLLQCCHKPTKTLSILSEVWKRTSHHGLFSLATRNKKVRQRKKWGRGKRKCFGHLFFVVILVCVSVFLLLTSRLLNMPAKKGDKVVGFPQSLLLSGEFSLEYCVSGSGRSSGAWSGWDCWPEEIYVSAVTRCFQESQKNASFQNWPVRALLASGR